jgi:hypothetical protein
MRSLMTLILTFSLREKEFGSTRNFTSCTKLPRPEGEGWDEGQSVFALVSEFDA